MGRARRSRGRQRGLGRREDLDDGVVAELGGEVGRGFAVGRFEAGVGVTGEEGADGVDVIAFDGGEKRKVSGSVALVGRDAELEQSVDGGGCAGVCGGNEEGGVGGGGGAEVQDSCGGRRWCRNRGPSSLSSNFRDR